MKKRIIATLLSALLLANVTACSFVPENGLGEDTTKETTGSETNDIESSETDDTQSTTDMSNTDTTPTYSTQELVVELQLSSIFASVLQNETTVYGSFLDSKENGYLNDFIIGSMPYAYVSALDLDENGVNDVLVLEDGDKVIVLKEHEGAVYAWQYRHTALYNLLVDGTYSWSEQAGQIYGSAKLQFDGTRRNDVELDRVENNEKFYINEIEISKDAFQTYVQNKKLAEKAERYWWETKFEAPEYSMGGK